MTSDELFEAKVLALVVGYEPILLSALWVDEHIEVPILDVAEARFTVLREGTGDNMFWVDDDGSHDFKQFGFWLFGEMFFEEWAFL